MLVFSKVCVTCRDLNQTQTWCTGRLGLVFFFSFCLKADTQSAFLIIKLFLPCSHLVPGLLHPSAKQASIFCSPRFWQKPRREKRKKQNLFWDYKPGHLLKTHSTGVRGFALPALLPCNGLDEPTSQQITHQKPHRGRRLTVRSKLTSILTFCPAGGKVRKCCWNSNRLG